MNDERDDDEFRLQTNRASWTTFQLKILSMRFFVGASGYSYKEWKETFYPAKPPQKRMLSYYFRQFWEPAD